MDSSAGQKLEEFLQMEEEIIANFYDFYMVSGMSNMTLEDSIKSQKETQENRIIKVSDQDSNDQDANNQDLKFSECEVEKLDWEIIGITSEESEITKRVES